jgi:hypothetical protein
MHMHHIYFLFIAVIFVSCNALPQLYQAVEDIADDNAVQIILSKEAIQKQTDLDISVSVKNK